MKIDITARHVEVTEAMKEHAQAKLEKIGAEFPQIDSAHMILNVEKYRCNAEILVTGKKFLRMEAAESSTDLYASIDTVVDTIEKRLRKSVDKKHSHKARLPLAAAAEQIESVPGNE